MNKFLLMIAGLMLGPQLLASLALETAQEEDAIINSGLMMMASSYNNDSTTTTTTTNDLDDGGLLLDEEEGHQQTQLVAVPSSQSSQSDTYTSQSSLLPPTFYSHPKLSRVGTGASSRTFGSLSMPGGSKWCGGKPTYWLVGHENPERPWCKDPNGQWRVDTRAELDVTDDKNKLRLSEMRGNDMPAKIDRHDCVHLDCNNDGLQDIACFVGAVRSKGLGYNELYLTQPDGSVRKVQDHGLQKYPSSSTRIAVVLKHASGSNLIFVGNNGRKRDDQKSNANRMYRNLLTGKPPYFVELSGPFNQRFDATCAVKGDLNNDGFDDLIVCEKDNLPHIYLQNKDGQFREVKLPSKEAKQSHLGNWRNVRIANITNNELPDIVSVEGKGTDPAYLHVFRGKETAPYFKFYHPAYKLRLPHAPADVEILDVNKDQLPDIYVSLAEEKEGTYCGTRGGTVQDYWEGNGRPWPIASWIPPQNLARDRLLVGTRKDGTMFEEINMYFYGRGCASIVQRFGNGQTLLVSRGRHSHSGYNYLLEWGTAKDPAGPKEKLKTTNNPEKPDPGKPTRPKPPHKPPPSKAKKTVGSRSKMVLANPCKEIQCKNGKRNCIKGNKADGTRCDEFYPDNTCQNEAICDQGNCVISQFEPVGTPCGDEETSCMTAASCSADGQCIPPQPKPVNTLCGDEETSCMTAAVCDANGRCISPKPKAANQSCGAEETACMTPALCSVDGQCVSPTPKFNAVCGAEETDCMTAAKCSVDGRCIPPQPKPVDTPCGAKETACMTAAKCSLFGRCMPPRPKVNASCGAKETSCMTAAKCSVDGQCIPPEPKPVDTPCGNEETSCMTAAKCSLDGQCILPQPKPVNTPCGDEETSCMTAAVCSTAGQCRQPMPKPVGTRCGNDPVGACDMYDICDGAGKCIDLVKPTTEVCREASSDCDVKEFCDGSNKECPANNFAPVGQHCGDQSRSECNRPDICSGTGECMKNWAPEGSFCGFTGDSCNFGDSCQQGVCKSNGPKPKFTKCGDQTEGICNHKDYCDGEGKCLDNFVKDRTLCGKAADDCNFADYCLQGKCTSSKKRNGTACGPTPRSQLRSSTSTRMGAGGNNGNSSNKKTVVQKGANGLSPLLRSGLIQKHGTRGGNSNNNHNSQNSNQKRKKKKPTNGV